MAKLKFFYGTMGSGKSTELIKTCDIYERKGIQTAIIKPTTDDRNGKIKEYYGQMDIFVEQ